MREDHQNSKYSSTGNQFSLQYPLPELNTTGNPHGSNSPGEALCPKELERELVEMGKCGNHPVLFSVLSRTMHQP